MAISNTAAIAHMYNSRSSAYDESHDSLHVRQTKSYLSQLGQYLLPGASLLDLACGTGLLTIPATCIVGEDGRVVGVDVSTGMLDIARSKSQEQHLDIEWYEHDISDLASLQSGRAGGFDIITCASALVLLPYPAEAVRSWSQLLKPGGRLMTDVHVPSSNVIMDVFTHIGPEIGETLKWDMTIFRDQTSLGKMIEDAGMEVERLWESEGFGAYEIDTNHANDIFESALENPMFANFGTEGLKERASEAFVRRLTELGGVEGKIRENTRYWMCIGKKPS